MRWPAFLFTFRTAVAFAFVAFKDMENLTLYLFSLPEQ
jgi:hypothetical protein